ncbi:glycosyltransferase family 39 protein [bacterium]|nr:glycosyltransferase family 39 protein [bacterium]
MEKILGNKKLLLLVMVFVFILTYLVSLHSYPLLDVDETRYVDMAKKMLNTNDYMTLYLNGEYFFEKPPLFFWLECLSFKIFGVSEFSARFPIVMLSLLPLGLLFGLCNKIKGFLFAFITTIILMTTLEYALITKIAILDSVLSSFCVSSVLSYFYTFFVEDKNKKWFWLLSYIFMGLAVLAKGIPGFVIPVGTIFISTIIFKTYKETLKSLLYGIPIFLLIALPWHILMLKTYPGIFYQEYIYKHHILRFLGSEVIHRNEPWYFYILTLIWGLIPHTIMFFGIKNIKMDKFLSLNLIAALTTLVFFSLSGAKLITYILPIYPFIAVIIAQIWCHYIEKDNKLIKMSLLILNSILVFGALVFPFVAMYVFKVKLDYMYLVLVALFIVSFYLLSCIIKNKRFTSFVLQSVFFALLLGSETPLAYNVDYSFGQNDLLKFAKIAKENKFTISAYKTGTRYSLLYYSDLPQIVFKNEDNQDWLNEELKKKNNILIMRNRDIENYPVKIKNRGVKYSIIERLDNEE